MPWYSKQPDLKNDPRYLEPRITENAAQLAEKAKQSDVQNFNLMAQSPRPPKQGVSTSSPKLAIKKGIDYFNFIQKANKGYVAYLFNTNDGTAVDSHGVNWELVRLKEVRHLADAYLAYTNHVNVVGTLIESVAPSQAPNAIEMRTNNYDSTKAVNTANDSNKTENVGIGLYYIESATAPSSVDWVVKKGKKKKANILMWASSTSSDDIDILVNGSVVKHVNQKAFYTGASEAFFVEFEIPSDQYSSGDITITLRNNSLTSRAYFSCLNFTKLKDYDGEHVDTYKTLANSLKFIDAVGASDYAIKEWNGLYCGSYHGGETRETGRLTWKNPLSPIIKSDADVSLYNFEDIAVDDWCVLDSLVMYQQTDLIAKAKMISEFNFDVDGTLDLSFGLYNNTINIEVIYTALTCTHLDFKYVSYPTVDQILDGSGEHEYEIVEGKFIQRSASRNAEMIIRFTKFNDYLYDRNPFINATPSYNKFYYGAVSTIAGGVVVPNLNFSKSLDFHVW